MDIYVVNRESAEKYLSGVVEVHYGAYSREHFTSCFSKALLQDYYRSLIAHSDISIVATEAGSVVGFVVAGYNVGNGVSKFVEERRFAIVKVFLRNPRFIVEKGVSILCSKFLRGSSSIKVSPFRLMSIAVRADAQSHGVGATLLSFLEKTLSEEGINSYGLSVRKENARAVQFYMRNSFEVQKESRDSIYLFKEIKNV